MSNIKPHKVFELFTDGRRLYTENLVPGKTPFDERKVFEGASEFREFDPTRSKVAACIAKGATNIGLRKSDIILYLGVSHGYTASFISDMIGKDGLIFGVDPAPRVVRDLIFLSHDRPNIVPLLCDANHPEQYQNRICEPDIIIQDVAQRNQAEIFLKNCELLKKGGYGLLAVKARSIDAKKPSKQIFEEVRKQIEEKLTVIDFRNLEPYEKDHCMIIIKNEPPKESKKARSDTDKNEEQKSKPPMQLPPRSPTTFEKRITSKRNELEQSSRKDQNEQRGLTSTRNQFQKRRSQEDKFQEDKFQEERTIRQDRYGFVKEHQRPERTRGFESVEPRGFSNKSQSLTERARFGSTGQKRPSERRFENTPNTRTFPERRSFEKKSNPLERGRSTFGKKSTFNQREQNQTSARRSFRDTPDPRPNPPQKSKGTTERRSTKTPPHRKGFKR